MVGVDVNMPGCPRLPSGAMGWDPSDRAWGPKRRQQRLWEAVDGCVGLPMHVLGWDDSMLHQSARGRVGQVRSGGAIRDPSVWDVSSGVWWRDGVGSR